MLKELIKMANHLDAKGLTKEADYLDNIIKKMASGPDKHKALRVAGRALASMINLADGVHNPGKEIKRDKFKIEEGKPIILNAEDATMLYSAVEALVHGDDISEISKTIPRITPGVESIMKGGESGYDFYIAVEDDNPSYSFYIAYFKVEFTKDDSYTGSGEDIFSSATVVVTLELIMPPDEVREIHPNHTFEEWTEYDDTPDIY
jgi:hypothetical protein